MREKREFLSGSSREALTPDLGEVHFIWWFLQRVLFLAIFGYRVARVEHDSQTPVRDDTQAEMVHEQPLRTSLVEIRTRLPKQRVHAKAQVEFLAP